MTRRNPYPNPYQHPRLCIRNSQGVPGLATFGARATHPCLEPIAQLSFTGSPNHVMPQEAYTPLSEQRKRQGNTISSKATKRGTSVSLESPMGSIAQQFAAAILELGATRAEQLFQTTVARLRGLAK